MQHRTRVLKTSAGDIGVCSCGYTTTASDKDARIAINDHEVAAITRGVKVTYLDPAQEDLPLSKRPK